MDSILMIFGTTAFVGVVGWLVVPRMEEGVGMSKAGITHRQIVGIGRCIERFRASEGRLPARLDELRSFEPDGLEADAANASDAWGGPYLYTAISSDRFDLRSLGADGAPGGEGDDADLVWEPAPSSPGDR